MTATSASPAAAASRPAPPPPPFTAALLELTLGVVAGNVFDLNSQRCLDFIESFASIVPRSAAG